MTELGSASNVMTAIVLSNLGMIRIKQSSFFINVKFSAKRKVTKIIYSFLLTSKMYIIYMIYIKCISYCSWSLLLFLKFTSHFLMSNIMKNIFCDYLRYAVFFLIGLGFMAQLILLNLQDMSENPICCLIILGLVFVNIAFFPIQFELNFAILASFESKFKSLLNKQAIAIQDITYFQVKI